MLARLGLADLPVATNATVLGRGGAGVTFPYGHAGCLVCGTCKRERVRRHQAAGRAVVFVGDGPSDRYAAHHADVIFAKGSLAAWCEAAGHRVRTLGATRGRGRVAGVGAGGWTATLHAARVRAWSPAAAPRVPAFICGPEVWGEGRTVAPHEE